MNETPSAQAAPEPTKRRNTAITVNETRVGNMGLEVKIGGTWCPAMQHSDYVMTIESQLYTPEYTHGRLSGQVGPSGGAFDKTAYVASQIDWGKSREHRPAVLFELYRPEGAYLATNPPALSRVIDGVDRVIIDPIRNRPLRDFQILPLTISTKVEGWLQEAWLRLNPSLELDDLLQRMPYTVQDQVYTTRKIRNRMVRRRGLFRDAGRCLPWKRERLRKPCQIQLIQQIRDNPNPTNPNSTRHLLDLTSREIKAFDDDTYQEGRHRNRAGNNQLTGQQRERKDRETEQRRQSRVAHAFETTSDTDNDEQGEDEPHITNGGGQSGIASECIGEPQDMRPAIDYSPDLTPLLFFDNTADHQYACNSKTIATLEGGSLVQPSPRMALPTDPTLAGLQRDQTTQISEVQYFHHTGLDTSASRGDEIQYDTIAEFLDFNFSDRQVIVDEPADMDV